MTQTVSQERRNYLADLWAGSNTEMTDAELVEIREILAAQCQGYRSAPEGMYSQAAGTCLHCGRGRH